MNSRKRQTFLPWWGYVLLGAIACSSIVFFLPSVLPKLLAFMDDRPSDVFVSSVVSTFYDTISVSLAMVTGVIFFTLAVRSFASQWRKRRMMDESSSIEEKSGIEK